MKNKIFSIRSWMESNAIDQFNKTIGQQGIIRGAGMPDMHVGKYGPNGAALLSSYVHPVLAGSDIGCGYGFGMIDGKVRIDRMVNKLNEFDSIDIDVMNYGIDKHCDVFGTIGGGNHFLEFQQVEDIVNMDLFKSLNMYDKATYVFVHTGSRGYGGDIMRQYIEKWNDTPLMESDDIECYMKQHNDALSWAITNRRACLDKVSELCNRNIHSIFDVTHNFIEPVKDGYLHRKGASTALCNAVMVAGSRGDLSALVRPRQLDSALNSIAHGAGRKITRSDAHYKVKPRVNKVGNHVICGDKNLMLEEDASCYKNISHVVDDMVNAGLVDVIAWMRPVITYKTPVGKDNRREKEKLRDIERNKNRKEKNKWRGY